MRRPIATAAAPRRWRRRRTARIVLAVSLVVLAPVAGRSHPDATNTSTAAASATGGESVDAAAEHPGDRHGPPAGDVRVVPIPLADPAVAELLRPGDLVDLVSAADISPHPATDTLVARAARVREIPARHPGSRSILVEVPQPEAARIAAIAAGTPLAVLIHG